MTSQGRSIGLRGAGGSQGCNLTRRHPQTPHRVPCPLAAQFRGPDVLVHLAADHEVRCCALQQALEDAEEQVGVHGGWTSGALIHGRVQRLLKRDGSSTFTRLLARRAGFWSICASQHAIEGRNILLTNVSQQTLHRVHCQCLNKARSSRAMQRHPAMHAESCLGAALSRR